MFRGLSQKHKHVTGETTLQTTSQATSQEPTPDETITGAGVKKPYLAPKLTHEGKWDAIVQFGGSFVAPP